MAMTPDEARVSGARHALASYDKLSESHATLSDRLAKIENELRDASNVVTAWISEFGFKTIDELREEVE